ncbi:hypothetical protein ACP70R_042291 [Stipagrostis hirtigluma subsp. patula]
MARRPRSRRTRQASSSWPDLPSELLGVVLLRLSFADRACLAKVCRTWSSGARLQPLPAPPPWLILRNGTFLDLADNAVHRMPVPNDARCRGSADNWLVVMSERSHRWYLMNPFSGATLPLPELTAFWRRAYASLMVRFGSGGWFNVHNVYVKKVAVSWEDAGSPRRKNPVLAAVIHDKLKDSRGFKVVVCRPGAGLCPSSSIESKRGADDDQLRDIQDITFFKGKLYAVSHDGELIAIKLRREGRRAGRPVISGVERVAHGPDLGPDPTPYPNLGCTLKPLYLVPSGDRLLMVSRWTDWRRSPIFDDCSHWTFKFEVFEAEFGGAGGSFCRWEKVDSLRGRALYVGTHGSGSVPATRSPAAGGVREDRIYYMHQDACSSQPENPLADSGVYDMRDGSCSKLGVDEEDLDSFYGPDAARGWGHGYWFPTWLFPAGTTCGDDRDDRASSKRAHRI